MKTRIAQLISYKCISASKFADMLSIQRSSISHILSGRNNPGLDILQKIIHTFPEISAEWLLTGKGEMLKDTLKSTSLFTKPESENIQHEPLKNEQNVIHDSEDPALYGKFTNVNNIKHVRKIILVYYDDTFKILNPRKSLD